MPHATLSYTADMHESFADILAVGGKSNSLGRSGEVIAAVLADHGRLPELYDCMFHNDPWLRMRAADSFEKICRVHPDWIEPYAERLISDLATTEQASIQWHLAQIYQTITLTSQQQRRVIAWLTELLSSPQVDWIVAANAMDTLAQFSRAKLVAVSQVVPLLRIQQQHKSAAVAKRATKHLQAIDPTH